MEWWSHSSRWDHGGLGEEDWHQLGYEGEGHGHCLNPLLPVEWVLLLPNQEHPSHCLSSRAWSFAGSWEHPWLLGDSAGPLLPCRPAWVRHLESSLCSSFMTSSGCACVNMLGATTYLPLYIHSVTSRRLVSLASTRVHTLWCSMAASDGSDSRGSPWEHLWHSLCYMAVAFWNICSIHVYGWHSTLDIPSSFHPGRVQKEGPILPLSWNSLFFECTPLPFFPISQNSHCVRWSIPPFCHKQSVF